MTATGGITATAAISSAGGIGGANSGGGTSGTTGTATSLVFNDGANTVTTGGGANDGISGIISGLNLSSTGSGTLKLSGANNYTGTTSISNGTLQTAAATAIPTNSNVTLTNGKLSGSGSFTENMGTLTVSGSSGINFASGSPILKFAASNGISWTSTPVLTITGWSGASASSGTAGQLFVGTTTAGLTAGQLADITFSTNVTGTGMNLSTGELVPYNTLPSITLATKPTGQVPIATIGTPSNLDSLYTFQLTGAVSNTTVSAVQFITTGTATGTDITDFKLYSSTTNTFASASIVSGTANTLTGGAAGTYNFTGLTQPINSGTTYYFWIVADIASGSPGTKTVSVSALSNTNITIASGSVNTVTLTAGGVQTISSAPIVTTAAASSVTATTATVNGTVNGNGVSSTTYFNYGTSTSPYNNLNVAATPGTVTGSVATGVSLALSGLTANTVYNFQAGAISSNGTGTGTNFTFTTLPNAPTPTAASSISTTGFTANWTAPASQGAVSFTYTIQVSTSASFSTIAASVTGLSSATLSSAFTGLPAVTTYYYRIEAVNSTGASVWSNTATVTTDLIATSSCGTTPNTAIQSVVPALAPVIDGSIDAIWGSATSNSITNVTTGTTDNTATWKALWTTDSL